MRFRTMTVALFVVMASAPAEAGDNGLVTCGDGTLGWGPQQAARQFCEAHGGTVERKRRVKCEYRDNSGRPVLSLQIFGQTGSPGQSCAEACRSIGGAATGAKLTRGVFGPECWCAGLKNSECAAELGEVEPRVAPSR